MYLYKLTHKISVFERYKKKFMLMEKPSRVLKEALSHANSSVYLRSLHFFRLSSIHSFFSYLSSHTLKPSGERNTEGASSVNLWATLIFHSCNC